MNPREEYKKLLGELRALQEQMKTETFTAEQLADVKTKMDRAKELKSKVDELDAMQAQYAAFGADFDRLASRGSVTDRDRTDPGDPGGSGGTGTTGQQAGRRLSRKRLGEYFVEQDAYKNRKGGVASVDVPGLYLPGQRFSLQPMDRLSRHAMERYELVAGGGLTLPFEVRPGTPPIEVILPLKPNVRDALTNLTTQNNLVPFIRQDLDTTDNNAAFFQVDGTNVKPESDIGWIDDEAPVRTIATVIPVNEQDLDDVLGLQNAIETELVAFLRDAEDDGLLNGNGTPPNILGIRNMDIQIADNTYFGSHAVPGVGEDREDIDRLQAAFTLVRQVARAEPSSVIMSPATLDWFLGVTNANGDYYAGNPFTTTDLARYRGKPIVVSNKIADDHALVLDGRYFVVYDRMAARVDVGYVDKQFIQNWKTLRAEERLALAGIRPAAAVDVTFENAGG